MKQIFGVTVTVIYFLVCWEGIDALLIEHLEVDSAPITAIFTAAFGLAYASIFYRVGKDNP